MTRAQDRSDGDDATKSTVKNSTLATQSVLGPTTEGTKHWAKKHRTFLASSASSMLASASLFPLESVKTRMQSKPYANARACFKETYKTEGLRAFWRAATVPTVTITMVRTTSFSIYQKAKYSYSAALGRATGVEEPLVTVNKPGSMPTFSTVACFAAAGGTAGSLTVLLSCPFELMKNSTQISQLHHSMDDPVKDNVRNSYSGKGSIKTAMNIVKHRGVLGLYSGFRLHLLRDSLGSTIYFATYESLKQSLVKFQGSDSPVSPLSVVIAGGLCGMVAWICTYPIDTAKTQYQRNCLAKTKGQLVERPKIDYFRLTKYRGLSISLTRTGLINAIFFSSFEFLKKKINQLPDPAI